MSEYDHSPQRLLDARRAKREAKQRVRELVEPLKDALAKLKQWESLEFTEHRPDGSFTISHSENQISLNDMPFLRPAAEAIQQYRTAIQNADAAWYALTEDQRKDIGPEQD